ncbi:MAG: RDD family protein [Spirochaetaceae bacterium]|nr:RDD family protein [Spirochaetaceae bacterium]
MDSSLGVQTPEGIEFVLYTAGLPVRACAYGIDLCVQWAFIGGAWLINNSLKYLIGPWLAMLFIFCVNWFYQVFCELCFKGQSLGKRIMGLRVVRSDGAPVNPGASFLRNLLRFADTFMFLSLIALVCVVFSRGFRRIGDWAADTLVVYTANARSPVRPPGGIPEVPVIVPPRPLSYEEKQAILMFARRYSMLGPARAAEIAHDYAAWLRGTGSAGDGSGDGEYLLGIARRLSGDGVSPKGEPPGGDSTRRVP